MVVINMKNTYALSLILCILNIFSLVAAQCEGETKCTFLKKCPSALKEIEEYNGQPTICGFKGKVPFVCCAVDDVEPSSGEEHEPDKETDQCNKYRQRIPPFIFFGIVGGRAAGIGEFPHVALLGFGNEDNIQWECGGTLISEHYVLTAAHCMESNQLGPVKFVRLGVLDVDDSDSSVQNFTIVERIPHPEYKSPFHYHDIALLKLDAPAVFTKTIKPACLHRDKDLSSAVDNPLTIAGWGKTDFAGDTSSRLLTADIFEVPFEECRKSYGVDPNRLPDGIQADLQICAADEGKDACQGDSGGPIQVHYGDYPQHVEVVGVTSFGKVCGISRWPGVYTRVSAYVPWIEAIVWPSEQQDSNKQMVLQLIVN